MRTGANDRAASELEPELGLERGPLTMIYSQRALLLCCLPVLLVVVLVAGLICGPVVALAWLHDDVKRTWRLL
jgi:hypothetical protein